MQSESQTATLDPLLARAAVCGLFARLLGRDPHPLADGPELPELLALLEQLGEDEAVAYLDEVDDLLLPANELLGRRTRLFDQGRTPPYEMTYVPSGLAGPTGALADIAGFYKAFGFRVEKERPDHCVAELEFFSLLALAEKKALTDGDEEAAATCAAASRNFLRDHLGGWFDYFAAQLEQQDPGGPFAPVVMAAYAYLQSEAHRLDVVPARPALPMQYLGDDEPELPECGVLPEAAVHLPGFEVVPD